MKLLKVGSFVYEKPRKTQQIDNYNLSREDLSMHLDPLLTQSLTAFQSDLKRLNWKGRERETVSLFAFGYLAPYVAQERPLSTPQLDIDGKEHVCKDLVIWPKRAMTVWDDSWEPKKNPAAILEWKVIRPGIRASGFKDGLYQDDTNWLTIFSRQSRSPFSGYCITLNLANNYELNCGRASEGAFDPRFVLLP